MKLFSEHKNYKLYQGSMLDMLEIIEPESIDCIITDPPYELNFMGKGWDNAGVSFNADTWKKCLRVLKPGGYLLAFGGSRTYHRIACAIEDGGFEIRDCIMWLYGSGFPKSMDISKQIDKRFGAVRKVVGTREVTRKTDNLIYGKYNGGTVDITIPATELAKQWEGWGTCLKPAYEPIIIARKPFKGSLVDNVIENGVGGLNIDECRVGNETTITIRNGNSGANGVYGKDDRKFERENPTGRFPANTILTYDETNFNEVCGGFPISGTGNNKGTVYNYAGKEYDNKANSMFNGDKPQAPSNYNDTGSASRYFYCAKASKKDRDEGLEEFVTKTQAEINNRKEGSAGSERAYGGGTNPFLSVSSPRKNIHPTVKPTELMQYLIRLVAPRNATILDPFMGSGSTGKAVMYENKERNKNYKFIGIELTEEYLPIANARISYIAPHDNDYTIDDYINEVI